MIRFVETIFNNLNLKRAFWLMALLFAVSAVWQACNIYMYMGDTVEHLHASYLISIGQVPFRDFFEHHQPLLWYILLPIIKIFDRSLWVVYVARFIALAGYGCCFYTIYKIATKIFDRSIAKVSLIVLWLIPNLWEDIMDLRPDIFMLLFVLIGIYQYLLYTENKKLCHLIYAYVSMSLSFLFLQKSLLVCCGFGIANLVALKKRQIPSRHFLIAVIAGLLPILSFLGIIYYAGAFEEYWYNNFILPTYVKEYFADFAIISSELKIFFYIAIVIGLVYYSRSEKYAPLFLCSAGAGLTCLIMAPYPQYYIPFFVLFSPFLGDFICKNNFSKICGITLFLICFFRALIVTEWKRDEQFTYYVDMLQYVIDSAKPGEKIITLSGNPYNIFNPDADYHWFGFNNIVIIDLLNNPKHDFNFNDNLLRYKPEFIIYGNVEDLIMRHRQTWFIRRNRLLLKRSVQNPELKRNAIKFDIDFWQPQEDILRKAYEPTEHMHIWKRKKTNINQAKENK